MLFMVLFARSIQSLTSVGMWYIGSSLGTVATTLRMTTVLGAVLMTSGFLVVFFAVAMVLSNHFCEGCEVVQRELSERQVFGATIAAAICQADVAQLDQVVDLAMQGGW